jgi:hypothetical protein
MVSTSARSLARRTCASRSSQAMDQDIDIEMFDETKNQTVHLRKPFAAGNGPVGRLSPSTRWSSRSVPVAHSTEAVSPIGF